MDSRRRGSAVLIILAFGLCACTHRAVVPENEGGVTGGPDLNTRDWYNPTAAGYIYLVDASGVLLRFSPKSLKVDKIGQISCLVSLSAAHSMSVDRYGVAWVNFRPGVLTRVNTKTAKCQPTGYLPSPGFDLYGMGFAPPGPGSAEERLYITSSMYSKNPTGKLAYLDTTTLKVHVIGSFPKAETTPELTGTRNGKLYGYLPGKSKSLVVRLDQGTAKALKTWTLPGLGHQVAAWAFAHWGGMFYLFISDSSGSSRVIRLNPSTGKSVTVIASFNYFIVGAGVSSKAPGAANDLGI